MTIWKRRDAEFAEQGSIQNPLRSPRLRVSYFRSFVDAFLECKDAKAQRRKDFDSDLCVLASLRLGVFLLVLLDELSVPEALTQPKRCARDDLETQRHRIRKAGIDPKSSAISATPRFILPLLR